MMRLWTFLGILVFSHLSPTTEAAFEESGFFLNPSSHILSVTWSRPSFGDIVNSGLCGNITVYEKFVGPEKILSPADGDFHNCSNSANNGMDTLVLDLQINSFKVKQFRSYRVCVEAGEEQACTRKFSIETAIPHRVRNNKKKDPFVETTFYLDSFTHQLSLEWTRRTAGIQGKCLEVDVFEKFLGPEKLLTPSHEESYECEYTTKDGMDHLTVNIDISSYKVQQFRSYTVCVKVEEGGGVEKPCTRKFSVETVVPYKERTKKDRTKNINIENKHDGTVISNKTINIDVDSYGNEEILVLMADSFENSTKYEDLSISTPINSFEENDDSLNEIRNNQEIENELNTENGLDGKKISKEYTPTEERGFKTAIILEKTIQNLEVNQIKHNNIQTDNKFHKVEIKFKEDSVEVDKIETKDTLEKLEKHVDDSKNESLDQSYAKDTSSNVYVVLIMTFLHYQRYMFD